MIGPYLMAAAGGVLLGASPADFLTPRKGRTFPALPKPLI